MSKAELIALLLRRLTVAKAKGKLQALLKDIKESQNLDRLAFRTSGTMEELVDAATVAAERGWLTDARLAQAVDEVEETGGQHIFLFRLTDEGRQALSARRLQARLATAPAGPTLALYADEPAQTRTFVLERPDGIIVKQVFTASYWEKDEERSYSGEDERATYMVRKRRRAVNLLRVQPESLQAEMRIDRVRGAMDDSLAREHLEEFSESLSEVLDLGAHMEPLPIWSAFNVIAENRDEIYMTTDEAEDASVQLKISNRRARQRGTDVRDHPNAPRRNGGYSRRTLNVYWKMPGGDDVKHHTILSRVEISGRAFSKVYVGAKIGPDELNHVLARIRHFTHAAS